LAKNREREAKKKKRGVKSGRAKRVKQKRRATVGRRGCNGKK